MFIDLPAAVRGVLQAIKQKGADHVVRECINAKMTDDGPEPVCLVGTALVNLGVDPQAFFDKECSLSSASLTMDCLDIGYTASALNFLNRVQVRQDQGCTWGHSFSCGIFYAAAEMASDLAEAEMAWLTNGE